MNNNTIDAKEIKSNLRSHKKDFSSGIRIKIDNEFYYSNNVSNSLIIGTTQSGKTKGIINPLLYSIADSEESAVVVDIKGELWEATSGYFETKGYEVKLLDLYNPSKSFSWNPLQIPYESFLDDNNEEVIHYLSSLAESIFFDSSSNDDFWYSTSSDLFVALALSLFKSAQSKAQINLRSIAIMGGCGNERIGSQSVLLAFYERNQNSVEYLFANAVINSPQETRQSIFSVFNNRIQHYSLNTKLTRALSKSEIDIKNLRNKKYVIFIRGSSIDRKTNSLISVFIKQCYSFLSTLKNEYVNFVLDDLCDLPVIPDLYTMLSNSAYYKFKFYLSVNSLSIMEKKYSENVMTGIMNNCLDWYILNCLDTKKISDVLGDNTANMLRELKRGDSYVFINGLKTFYTHFQDYSGYCKQIKSKRINESADLFNIETFDIKSVVKGNFPVPTHSSLDLDDLVKRIDSKIEELEAEERAEKEKLEAEEKAEKENNKKDDTPSK